MTKIDPEELKKLISEKKFFIPNDHNNGPTAGGILVKRCPACGGDIVWSDGGIKSEICSKCGRPYREPIFD